MLPCASLFNAQADACGKQKADTAVQGCGATAVVAGISSEMVITVVKGGMLKQIVSVHVGYGIADGVLKMQRVVVRIRCMETVEGAAIVVEEIVALGLATDRVDAEAFSFTKIDPLARPGAASVSP